MEFPLLRDPGKSRSCVPEFPWACGPPPAVPSAGDDQISWRGGGADSRLRTSRITTGAPPRWLSTPLAPIAAHHPIGVAPGCRSCVQGPAHRRPVRASVTAPLPRWYRPAGGRAIGWIGLIWHSVQFQNFQIPRPFVLSPAVPRGSLRPRRGPASRDRGGVTPPFSVLCRTVGAGPARCGPRPSAPPRFFFEIVQ